MDSKGCDEYPPSPKVSVKVTLEEKEFYFTYTSLTRLGRSGLNLGFIRSPILNLQIGTNCR